MSIRTRVLSRCCSDTRVRIVGPPNTGAAVWSIHTSAASVSSSVRVIRGPSGCTTVWTINTSRYAVSSGVRVVESSVTIGDWVIVIDGVAIERVINVRRIV